jgi:hypothetical protein
MWDACMSCIHTDMVRALGQRSRGQIYMSKNAPEKRRAWVYAFRQRRRELTRYCVSRESVPDHPARGMCVFRGAHQAFLHVYTHTLRIVLLAYISLYHSITNHMQGKCRNIHTHTHTYVHVAYLQSKWRCACPQGR